MILAQIQPGSEAIAQTEHHRLGMAEMGYRGLSEQWLMRRAGDLHWRLIASAMGQRDAVFTCTAGEPLYAAFCISRLFLTRPELPKLGAELALCGDLYRIGRSRLASSQTIRIAAEIVGRIQLVSVFVGHGEAGRNRSIVRRTPRVMALPPEAPAALRRLASRAAGIVAAAPSGPAPTDRLLPCPATDFNAAGLLYFPSFAALIERAAFSSGAAADRQLRARTTIYTGNAEPGEPIGIAFQSVGRARHIARLSGEDGRLLSLTRTLYL